MTRSDIGAIAAIYATCLLFFCLALQFKPAAQIYPMALIAGLALLNTLYLLRCILRLRSAEIRRIINDMPEVFAGFQPRQFFFVLAACLAYMLLLSWLGFYLAGFIYLVGCLFFLKVKPLPLCLTTVFLGCLIYGVFTLFLKVPLPRGLIFG